MCIKSLLGQCYTVRTSLNCPEISTGLRTSDSVYLEPSWDITICLLALLLSISDSRDLLSYKNNIFFFSFLQQHQLSSKIFSYLCEVVDDDKDVYDKKIYEISKLIILEGK